MKFGGETKTSASCNTLRVRFYILDSKMWLLRALGDSFFSLDFTAAPAARSLPCELVPSCSDLMAWLPHDTL